MTCTSAIRPRIKEKARRNGFQVVDNSPRTKRGKDSSSCGRFHAEVKGQSHFCSSGQNGVHSREGMHGEERKKKRANGNNVKRQHKVHKVAGVWRSETKL